MSASTTHKKLLSGSDRESYVKCLKNEGIPEKKREYYVARANQFISALACPDPAAATKEEINKTLTAAGRSNKLTDWQFAQLVGAVRIYFICFLRIEVADAIDWTYWSSSARRF